MSGPDVRNLDASDLKQARKEPVVEYPLTIKDAAAALRAGEFTSTELTTALLEKAKALNPTLGAYISFTEETAMAEAAAADAKFAAGIDLGPLQGIPYAAKDIIATKDSTTTANGLILDPAWGAGYDATVIAKLRAAGMVLTGQARAERVRHRHAGSRQAVPDAAEPVGPRTQRRRLELRDRHRGGGRPHPRRPGDRHRRVDTWAVVVERPHRHQADVRPRLEVRLCAPRV